MTRKFAVLAIVAAMGGWPSGGRMDAFAADDPPELSLNADVSPETVLTGSTVTYTLTVTNEGPGIAERVAIDDTLPPETTFVSCTATGGGACRGSGNKRRITFDAIMPDASETVTLIATLKCQVRDGEEIGNTAAVRSSSRDPEGDEDENETVFITASNPPPVISEYTVTPSLPWPSDHQMADVAVDYQVLDNCGPIRVALNVSRTESAGEASDGGPQDWAVVDARHVRVRAERSAPASRRIYVIAITAVDAANQASPARVVTLTVPPAKLGSASSFR
jgi:uncharacterized repeat protein (TIGR01451 family)